MYFKFLISPLAKSGLIDHPKIDGFDGTSFIVGDFIKEPIPEPLKFSSNATVETPPPDYMEMMIPVMSDRLVDALKSVGVDNLQCFDAIVENPSTGDSWNGFNAVNIIGRIACADLRQSVYDKIGGGLLGFDWLVVDQDKAHGALLFRLAEAPGIIIAHKKIGDHLYGQNCPNMTGFRFWPTAADAVAKMRADVEKDRRG